jgi:hypothetical protein
LGLSLLAGIASAQAPQDASLRRLKTDLAGPQSATQVLTRWCADLHLASPPVIKAVRARDVDKKADADIRARLAAGSGEPIRYRRVQLMCGSHVLSRADNWYRPGKLTADMNRQLDSSDAPFGAVVRSLNFRRQTLNVRDRPDAETLLEVKAVLISAAGIPFSLVVEDYDGELAASRP